ncbi:MAG: hypothetical protein H7039_10040, partial [Bryobacteraceae bacterium]|nr:hypothetical protein [Bryobacteraceae bacterium]
MSLSHSIEQHSVSRSWLAALIQKYWLLVLVVMLSGTFGMYVVLQVFFTDIYESNTRLLVKVGRENVETPSTVRNGQVFSQGVRSADINSEVQIMSSTVLYEKVVARLGSDRFKSVLPGPVSWVDYPKYIAKRIAREAKQAYREVLFALNLEKRVTPEQDAVLRLVDGIKVEPVKDSDILILKVRTPSPVLCLDVAETLLAIYMEQRTAIRRTSGGSKFFEVKLQEANSRMGALQGLRANIRNRWCVSAPEEQRNSYLRQAAVLETEIGQNEGELVRLRSQT